MVPNPWLAPVVIDVHVYDWMLFYSEEKSMGVGGIGSSLGTVGTQYNFTKMTNQQADDAAKALLQQGVLTADAAGRLEGAAQGIDSTPIDRSQVVSTAQTLADPTQKNWVSYMQESSDWAHSNPGTIGYQSTDTLLSELKSYQSSSLEESTKTISTQA